MNIETYMQTVGEQARQASADIARCDTKTKNNALRAIAAAILASVDDIKAANAKDLANGKANGLTDAMLDRLALTDDRIANMVEGLSQVTALSDPVGVISDMAYRPSGIKVGKMRVPLGVIGIIYESRPNVTIEAASLCIKSGNATILRGGSESIHSNQALSVCIRQGLKAASLSENIVQVIETTDREAVGKLITMNQYVDVIVPRGGKGLIERISKDATVTVIKHLDGICHVYIDEFADKAKAIRVAFNSKTHRYGTCNTMETLLVNDKADSAILLDLADKFIAHGVELRGCAQTLQRLEGKQVIPATPEDWNTEYLAPILSIKMVSDIEEAITHINHYGSHHTDAIITENYTFSRQFLKAVDSSSVMVNASTRFADGFEYGLGAEIGISTDKIHARGPVGLEGLTSQKYVVLGDGEIRE